MVQHATKQHREAAVQRKADLELRLSRIRAKEERARARFEAGEPAFKKQVRVPESILRALRRICIDAITKL